MKSLNKYIVLFSLIGLVALFGCEKDLEKINENSNRPTVAAPPALLAQAIRDFAYNNFDVWYGARTSGVISQHWSQRNYTSEDRYAFRSGTVDGFFRNNYIWMNNLQTIINLNTDPATKGNMSAYYGDNRMQIACAEIMKAWVFQLLTDAFGDIPYSQALQLDKYPQPVYDTQKDIYDGLIATLAAQADSLQAVIDDGGTGFAQGDILYQGNLAKWKKFANSLRLRLALRASKADFATYNPIALDAIADGVFTSSADNAQCKFSASGAPNEAPLYNGFFVSKRNDFAPTAQFLYLLKGQNNTYISYTNPFFGFVDPRYGVFIGPRYSAADLTKKGVPYGMSDADTKAYVALGGVVSWYLATNPPVFLKPNFPSTFMDYATVCFYKAELQALSAAEYKKGIEASLLQWGIDTLGKGATYIKPVVALFNAATDEQKREMIATQKYIHLHLQGYEAWAEYRRTGYPKSLVKPGQTTWISATPTTYVFTPVTGKESGTDICARIEYPSSEFTLNATNVNAAITRMGGDTHAYRVWWHGGGHQ